MNEYTQYCKDLLNLYSKTGHKEIESIFLKFSAEASQDILSWIMSNKQLKNKLSNPKVYDALEYMYKLNENKTLTSQDLFHMSFSDASFKNNIQYLVALSKLSKNPKYNEIFAPLGNIINLIAPFASGRIGIKGIDETAMASNLDVLIQSHNVMPEQDYKIFPTGKMNLKNQRELMFKNIARRYSFDLSEVANAQNVPKLAEELKKGALLLPYPAVLEEYLGPYQYTNTDIAASKKMADFFMLYTDSKYENYLYDALKTEFLNAAGQLVETEYMELKNDIEKNKSSFNLLGEENDEVKGIGLKDMVPPEMEMNSHYLFLVSTFFVFLQKYLKMPSSFEIG